MENATSDSSLKDTAKGVALSSTVAYSMVLVQFLITTVLIRNLSASDYGIYSFLLATITIIGLAGSLMLPSIARFLPDFIAKKEYFLAKRLVFFSMIYCLLLGSFFLFLFYLKPHILDSFFKSGSLLPIYSQIFGVILLAFFLLETADWSLVALIEVKVRNAGRFVSNCLFLFGTWLFLSFHMGLKGVLLSLLISYVFLFVLLFFKLKSILFSRPSTGKREFEVKRIARYGFLNQLNVGGDLFSNLMVDIYLVAFFLGTAQVGAYAFAVKIPQMIMQHSPAILGASIVFPFLVGHYSRSGEKGGLEYFFKFYCRFVAFYTLPVMAGLIFLAEPIIKLIFNPVYLEFIPVFIAATVYFSLISFRFTMIPIYNTLEKPQFGLYPKIFFLLSTLLNVYLLSKGHGLLTVILVSSGGLLCMGAAEFLLTSRYVALVLPQRELLRIAFSTCVMSLSLYFLKGFASNIFFLLGIVGAGAGVYFLSAYLVKPFTPQDHEVLLKTGRIGQLLRFYAKPV